MTLHNTRERYGLVAQGLHWATAVLFLLAYLAVYARQYLTDDETTANWVALQAHLSVGMSVLVFAGLRLWWRRRDVRPEEPPGRPHERLLARAMHWALYAIMILMPLTGYLGTGVDTHFLGLFVIPRFEDTAAFAWLRSLGIAADPAAFEAAMETLHEGIGEVLILVLVGLHAGAALFHHFVRRDRVLARMLPAR